MTLHQHPRPESAAPVPQFAPTADPFRIFREIGGFLQEHRLEPTPSNYLLVHQLITRTNAAAAAAVAAATGDGLRLTQGDADRIVAETGGAAPAVDDEKQKAEREEAARQMESFAAIVEKTRSDVEVYRQDLAESAAQLESVTDSAVLDKLIAITSSMIERTRKAERQLDEATEEANVLRGKLACASHEAQTDPLTGLPNRRAFEARYTELRAQGKDVSLALCDVDRFKGINDAHGHDVGDRVLKLFAKLLAGQCDKYLVARFGGEEFVILFQDMLAAEAMRIVDQARESIASRSLRVRDTHEVIGNVTFSAGVTEAMVAESAAHVLKRADRLLYRAKQRGRGRTEIG
ncbi:GGDEF domain-containing protein [Allosphingosinicella indica]|uniref:diguanylate cyclase n=1 Tax=Allosphingosinicella indica TaxID=941907 RepID=A0A1X7GNV3_9SPHN|nr:GGDEF domain-containing protein [Allosphingosinicella indica]SMF72398.1 diguanylate cyclase [Allosphingosinicella indica]